VTGPVSAAAASQAGPLGLLVIVLLAISVLLLGRSMAKHLRRVPPSFDPPPGPAGPTGPTGPAASTGPAAPASEPPPPEPPG
jgi:hypothetical protein